MRNGFQALTAGTALLMTAYILAGRSFDREAQLGQSAFQAAIESGVREKSATAAANFGGHPNLLQELALIETQLFASIPSARDLQRLSNAEAHGMPEAIERTGEQLARLAEVLASNPELAPHASLIYRRCAEVEDTANSIRALCYSNYLKWSGSSTGQVDALSVPRSVVELAAKIPNG
jgi:hypothetical protein